MGTLIRLASEVESGLKYYYMEHYNILNMVELQLDPDYKINIFQRLMPWSNDNVMQLFNKKMNYNLLQNEHFPLIKELMLNRHLYAHNTGLLSDKYVEDYKKLLGIDILPTLSSSLNYPQEDTYYFDPLKKLNDYIEGTRRFFSNLPEH